VGSIGGGIHGGGRSERLNNQTSSSFLLLRHPKKDSG
jgi:hypothetical protein